MFIVYKLTSPSGKVYIGFTGRPLKKRLQDHKASSKRNNNTKIERALQKYPLDDWHQQILLETENPTLAHQTEISMIEKHNSIKEGYNISSGGEHGALGAKRSDVVKATISKANKGRKHTEEQRKAQSLAQLGRKQSQHQKDAVAAKLSKRYKIVFPDGREEIITNLNQFCKSNKLYASNMCWLAKGKLAYYKGYKCTRIA